MVLDEMEKKRADVLRKINEKLQKFSNMSEAEQEAKIVRIGSPSPSALAKIKWLRNWEAESKARSMTKVL